ncbi:MAG: hypothetical protein ABIQ61_01405 [Ornithinibacter sp.]
MAESTGASARGDIEAQVREAGERAERAAAWAADMERITGHGTALRGGVTLEVDLGGTITGLGITDTAAAHGGQSVAQAIRTAHAQAQASVREQASRSSASLWGAGSATTAAVVSEVEGLTPMADAPPPESGTGPGAGGSW